MLIYACDLETTSEGYFEKTGRNDVWLAVIKEIHTGERHRFLNLLELTDFLKEKSTTDSIRCYYHNLQFDGSYFLYHFDDLGLTTVEKVQHKNEFSVLMGDDKTTYSQTYKLASKKIEHWDSLKIIPIPIKRMGKLLGIDKLGMDYEQEFLYNSLDEIPIEKIEYTDRDVDILQQFLLKFEEIFGLDNLTIGSVVDKLITNFLNNDWEKLTPYLRTTLSKEQLLRRKCWTNRAMYLGDAKNEHLTSQWYSLFAQNYEGGFNFLNPKYIGVLIEQEGFLADINSAYSKAMAGRLIYNQPLLEPPKGDYRTFYEVEISSFKLKPNRLPHISANRAFRSQSDYLSYWDTKNPPLVRGFWDEEFGLILNDYNINYIIKNKIYYRCDEYLKEYIEWLYPQKENAANKVIKELIKFALNNGYGKQGQKRVLNGLMLKEGISEDFNFYRWEPTRSEGYLHNVAWASLITSDARVYLISTINQLIDAGYEFLYCDTDSIICLGNPEQIDFIPFHSSKLGAWDIEYRFKKAKFLKNKCYILCKDNDITHDKRAISGASQHTKDTLSINDFYSGKKVIKLSKRWMKGGVGLIKTEMTL